MRQGTQTRQGFMVTEATNITDTEQLKQLIDEGHQVVQQQSEQNLGQLSSLRPSNVPDLGNMVVPLMSFELPDAPDIVAASVRKEVMREWLNSQFQITCTSPEHVSLCMCIVFVLFESCFVVF